MTGMLLARITRCPEGKHEGIVGPLLSDLRQYRSAEELDWRGIVGLELHGQAWRCCPACEFEIVEEAEAVAGELVL